MFTPIECGSWSLAPNSISIISSVFAGLTVDHDQQTDTQTDRQRYSICALLPLVSEKKSTFQKQKVEVSVCLLNARWAGTVANNMTAYFVKILFEMLVQFMDTYRHTVILSRTLAFDCGHGCAPAEYAMKWVLAAYITWLSFSNIIKYHKQNIHIITIYCTETLYRKCKFLTLFTKFVCPQCNYLYDMNIV